ncbi:MAG: RelA/SpoT domain-containing protein [Thermoleophilaceae bacterium]|nr:RelA/SpoT domain-containing protein [Thermoleophilaceae bacterium]
MIVDKLARLPGMRLSQMQDIGGCRAILPDRQAVAAVLARIERNWEVRGQPRNYSANPTPQGYRAMHVIVARDGRLVEIQLRTPREHSWAVAVERFSHQLGQDLKSGVGPPAMLRYLRLLSELTELRERGAPADQHLAGEFERLAPQVAKLLKRDN